jgi:dTDP-4-dehydrorhamnose reductase
MKVLILGASGYVGGALWRWLSARHDVVGTRGRRDVPGLIHVDVTDAQTGARLASDGFDLIIHTAGVVGLEDAEADPERARQVNVDSIRTLLHAVDERRTRILYLSSDHVFDGAKEFFVESDAPAPVNTYGRTKVAAERLLGESSHLVVRIPLVYGPSPIADRFLARFHGRQTPAQGALAWRLSGRRPSRRRCHGHT